QGEGGCSSLEQFSDAEESSCTDTSLGAAHPSLNIVVEDFDHDTPKESDPGVPNSSEAANQLSVKSITGSRSASDQGSAGSSTSMQTVVHALEEVPKASGNLHHNSRSSSCSDLSTCSDDADSGIVHRYYHVFKQGELDSL